MSGVIKRKWSCADCASDRLCAFREGRRLSARLHVLVTFDVPIRSATRRQYGRGRSQRSVYPKPFIAKLAGHHPVAWSRT